MRAAYDALDDETKAEVEGLVCEHSQIFSRQQLGFTDFTDEERERFKPVRQCLVRTHPVTGRKSLYLSSHAGGIVGWPVPEARAFLRDLIEHATQRAVRLRAQVAGRRPRDVGQPPDHAPRPALPRARAARHAPHHAGRRRPDRGAGRLRGRGHERDLAPGSAGGEAGAGDRRGGRASAAEHRHPAARPPGSVPPPRPFRIRRARPTTRPGFPTIRIAGSRPSRSSGRAKSSTGTRWATRGRSAPATSSG